MATKEQKSAVLYKAHELTLKYAEGGDCKFKPSEVLKEYYDELLLLTAEAERAN